MFIVRVCSSGPLLKKDGASLARCHQGNQRSLAGWVFVSRRVDSPLACQAASLAVRLLRHPDSLPYVTPQQQAHAWRIAHTHLMLTLTSFR